MNSLDAFVQDLTQFVDVRLVACADEHGFARFAKFGHPGALQFFERDIFARGRQQIILLLRRIGERVNLVEHHYLLRSVDYCLFFVFRPVLALAGIRFVVVPRVRFLYAMVLLQQFVDRLLHHLILLFEVRMRYIHHMNQQVRLAHFVQG